MCVCVWLNFSTHIFFRVFINESSLVYKQFKLIWDVCLLGFDFFRPFAFLIQISSFTSLRSPSPSLIIDLFFW